MNIAHRQIHRQPQARRNPFARKRKEDFIADIKRIRHKHKLVDTGIIDSELDLTGMIIRPKNMTKGPWYKCIKGHVYSLADRIDNGNADSCPHCLETKGTSWTQAQPVSHQVTLTEMRNMASERATIRPAKPGVQRFPRKNSKFHK